MSEAMRQPLRGESRGDGCTRILAGTNRGNELDSQEKVQSSLELDAPDFVEPVKNLWHQNNVDEREAIPRLHQPVAEDIRAHSVYTSCYGQLEREEIATSIARRRNRDRRSNPASALEWPAQLRGSSMRSPFGNRVHDPLGYDTSY